MAELVGLAASIIQIAGAGVTLSKTLYTYVGSATRADHEIADIAGDVETTANALDSVGKVFEDEDAPSVVSKKAIEHANNIVKRCDAVFKELHDVVDKRRKMGKDGKMKSTVLGKMSWPLKEPRVELQRRKLESLKNSLVLLLHVLQLANGQARGKLEKDALEKEKEKIRELHQRQQDSIKSLEALENKLSKVSIGDDEATLQGSTSPSRTSTFNTFNLMMVNSPLPNEKNKESQASHLKPKSDIESFAITDESEISDSEGGATDEEAEHLTLDELAKCAKHVQELLKRISTLQQVFEGTKSPRRLPKTRVHKLYRRFCMKFEYEVAPRAVDDVPTSLPLPEFVPPSRSGETEEMKVGEATKATSAVPIFDPLHLEQIPRPLTSKLRRQELSAYAPLSQKQRTIDMPFTHNTQPQSAIHDRMSLSNIVSKTSEHGSSDEENSVDVHNSRDMRNSQLLIPPPPPLIPFPEFAGNWPRQQISHAQQHHHHLPNASARRKRSYMFEDPKPDYKGPSSVVGLPGMPAPAPRPRSPSLAKMFTPEDDRLLIELKEKKSLVWKQIADFFPGRTSGMLQIRYHVKLKGGLSGQNSLSLGVTGGIRDKAHNQGSECSSPTPLTPFLGMPQSANLVAPMTHFVPSPFVPLMSGLDNNPALSKGDDIQQKVSMAHPLSSRPEAMYFSAPSPESSSPNKFPPHHFSNDEFEELERAITKLGKKALYPGIRTTSSPYFPVIENPPSSDFDQGSTYKSTPKDVPQSHTVEPRLPGELNSENFESGSSLVEKQPLQPSTKRKMTFEERAFYKASRRRGACPECRRKKERCSYGDNATPSPAPLTGSSDNGWTAIEVGGHRSFYDFSNDPQTLVFNPSQTPHILTKSDSSQQSDGPRPHPMPPNAVPMPFELDMADADEGLLKIRGGDYQSLSSLSAMTSRPSSFDLAIPTSEHSIEVQNEGLQNDVVLEDPYGQSLGASSRVYASIPPSIGDDSSPSKISDQVVEFDVPSQSSGRPITTEGETLTAGQPRPMTELRDNWFSESSLYEGLRSGDAQSGALPNPPIDHSKEEPNRSGLINLVSSKKPKKRSAEPTNFADPERPRPVSMSWSVSATKSGGRWKPKFSIGDHLKKKQKREHVVSAPMDLERSMDQGQGKDHTTPLSKIGIENAPSSGFSDFEYLSQSLGPSNTQQPKVSYSSHDWEPYSEQLECYDTKSKNWKDFVVSSSFSSDPKAPPPPQKQPGHFEGDGDDQEDRYAEDDDRGVGDADVECIEIGPPAQAAMESKLDVGGMAAEVDEGDPLYKEMMEGLAGGESSEESEADTITDADAKRTLKTSKEGSIQIPGAQETPKALGNGPSLRRASFSENLQLKRFSSKKLKQFFGDSTVPKAQETRPLSVQPTPVQGAEEVEPKEEEYSSSGDAGAVQGAIGLPGLSFQPEVPPPIQVTTEQEGEGLESVQDGTADNIGMFDHEEPPPYAYTDDEHTEQRPKLRTKQSMAGVDDSSTSEQPVYVSGRSKRKMPAREKLKGPVHDYVANLKWRPYWGLRPKPKDLLDSNQIPVDPKVILPATEDQAISRKTHEHEIHQHSQYSSPDAITESPTAKRKAATCASAQERKRQLEEGGNANLQANIHTHDVVEHSRTGTLQLDPSTSPVRSNDNESRKRGREPSAESDKDAEPMKKRKAEVIVKHAKLQELRKRREERNIDRPGLDTCSTTSSDKHSSLPQDTDIAEWLTEADQNSESESSLKLLSRRRERTSLRNRTKEAVDHFFAVSAGVTDSDIETSKAIQLQLPPHTSESPNQWLESGDVKKMRSSEEGATEGLGQRDIVDVLLEEWTVLPVH